MIETVIGVVGALVGIGGLATSYANHRHQKRQGQQLAERERRVEKREKEADRRESLAQASMVRVHVTKRRSQLDSHVPLPELAIVNSSNQPIRVIAARHGNEEIPFPQMRPVQDGILLTGGARITSEVLPGHFQIDHVQVEFIDAAGQRWTRLANGALRRGRFRNQAWEWGDVEPPVVTQYVHVEEHASSASRRTDERGRVQPRSYPDVGFTGRRSRRSRFTLTAVLVAALCAGLLTWALLLIV
ncbi:hypothetical protein [Streptomyces albus]|uniref:hypothetical protein n=1 Tax=Streptomyces albus TaxID=1888 RepID=UPI0034012B48